MESREREVGRIVPGPVLLTAAAVLVMALTAGAVAGALALLASSPSETGGGRSARARRVGSGVCQACHVDHHRFWADGGHAGVACESCHGAGSGHVVPDADPRPSLHLGGNEQCMTCHGLEALRPARESAPVESFDAHVKAIEKKHVIRVKRAKEAKRCVYCHDPHAR
jgi:hypothetical protein